MEATVSELGTNNEYQCALTRNSTEELFYYGHNKIRLALHPGEFGQL